MRRDLICALSLSGLLLACAHDRANETAQRNHTTEAQAEARAERHANAEGHDDHNKAGVARDDDGTERDQDGVEVPRRRAAGDRMATAGDELPARDADNTAINKRDRDGANVTPLDQGNSEIDIDLTQRIRKAVMDDDALSFKAKNVKIITRDGHVTLRGSVKTAEEKRAIGKAATAAAGATHVTNQLEVAD